MLFRFAKPHFIKNDANLCMEAAIPIWKAHGTPLFLPSGTRRNNCFRSHIRATKGEIGAARHRNRARYRRMLGISSGPRLLDDPARPLGAVAGCAEDQTHAPQFRAAHEGTRKEGRDFATLTDTRKVAYVFHGKNMREFGGLARNRTGVQGFAVLCVTTPPRGLGEKRSGINGLHSRE